MGRHEPVHQSRLEPGQFRDCDGYNRDDYANREDPYDRVDAIPAAH